MSTAPVFVTGYQRSGTTLLGNLLDRHPELAIFVESFFLPKYYYARWLYAPLSRGGNAVRLARAIAAEESAALNGLEVDEEAVSALEDPTLASVVDTLMRGWAASRGKSRWGDKSPGYLTKLPLLRRMFPEAKFVNIIRDGRDVFLSVKRLGWEDDPAMVALQWASAIGKARAFGASPGRSTCYLEVRYEELIQDPEAVLPAVFEFVGVEYSPSVLEPGARETQIQQLRDWPKINEKIDPSNVARWTAAMPEEEVERFEEYAGHVLRALGYPLADENRRTSAVTALGSAARRVLLAGGGLRRRMSAARDAVSTRLRA